MRAMPSALTSELLYKRALHYLERYAASSAGLRAVLQRSIKRHERRGEEIPAQAGQWIENVISKLQQAGYLNDKAFAETKLVSLRRAGNSTQKIRQKLMLKGVESGLMDEVLAADESNDRQAAIAFARRRRLGPFATTRRDELRDKHLAALARAGFALSLARQIINAPDADTLLEMDENC